MSDITFADKISVTDFCRLREAAGFKKLTTEQAERILSNTTYTVAATLDGKCVGIARLLFDFGVDAYITDLIVDESCRGQGLGRALVENVLSYIKENACGVKVDVSLFVMPNKEPFYEKFGFSRLPNDRYGHGMHLEMSV